MLALLLASAALAAAPTPFTPTCTIRVSSSTSRYVPGRLVTVTPAEGCRGAAYVRFASRTGTQPDAPPGLFTLRPGERVTRRVPADWWIEWRDKGLRWVRFIEPRRVP
jgi:hypothetical protein